MTTLEQTNTHAYNCSPEECADILKEAKNNFVILTDDEEMERRAKLFQALGNEVRLRILSLLAIQEMCACNIVEALEGAASTITHHLRKLENGELITSRRDGKFTIYRLKEGVLEKHRVFEEKADSKT